MSNPSKKHLCDQLRKLALAWQSFNQARLLAEHVLEIRPAFGLYSIYPPCMVGVVVSYVRPFTTGDSISSKFESFPNPELKATHTELRKARDLFHAHHIVTRGREIEFAEPQTDCPFDTFIEIMETDTPGHMMLRPSVAVPEILPETLPEIVTLCEFQMERVTGATKDLLHQFGLVGRSLKYGKFKIDEHFPDSVRPKS
jgi:hypothetical protein